jgi:hypothetical protein
MTDAILNSDGVEVPKPHIRLICGYYRLYRDSRCRDFDLIWTSMTLENIKKMGPWTPKIVDYWYGDAKKPV